MFSKYQYVGDALPPTKQALLYMIYRNYYSNLTSLITKPSEFGWNLIQDTKKFYESTMATIAT